MVWGWSRSVKPWISSHSSSVPKELAGKCPDGYSHVYFGHLWILSTWHHAYYSVKFSWKTKTLVSYLQPRVDFLASSPAHSLQVHWTFIECLLGAKACYGLRGYRNEKVDPFQVLVELTSNVGNAQKNTSNIVCCWDFIYLFDKEREKAQAGEQPREREKQAP